MERNETKRRAVRIATLSALAIGALLVADRSAMARPHGGDCGGKGGGHELEKLERGVGGLGLEQGALTAAYAVIDEARKERRTVDAELRAAHDRMRELLEQEEPDVEAVTAQADVIGALMTQARKIELRATVQVRSMLSPDQRKQMAERYDRHARRGKRGPRL